MDRASDYTAIFLAAGRGTRIRGQTAKPKILLELQGRTLLQRHLAALRAVGVRDVLFVVGHQKELVMAEAAQAPAGLRVRFVDNPEYASKGNTHSLCLGLRETPAGALVFDADLVYAPAILERFIASTPTDAILVGAGSLDDIEAAKALVDDAGRVRKTVDKRALTAEELRVHRFAGEAIGILKFSAAGRAALLAECERFLAEPQNALLNWEHVLNQFLPHHSVACHFETCEDWIEIDTPEDFQRAAQKNFDPRPRAR
ncbi:MAG: phosphocholine cytidylyltransferase family protein [Pedosphaera sp.]|nr:phosphocholine cytidylyltransferase family protein [Pedosphaera sp.]